MKLTWILFLSGMIAFLGCQATNSLSKKNTGNIKTAFETEYLACCADSILIRSKYKNQIDSCLAISSNGNFAEWKDDSLRKVVERADVLKIDLDNPDSIYEFFLCVNSEGTTVYSEHLSGGDTNRESLKDLHWATLSYKYERLKEKQNCFQCGKLVFNFKIN